MDLDYDHPKSSPTFSSPPSLPSLISLCVRTPTSPGPLRVAMHRYFKEPEVVMRVLEVINVWIEEMEVSVLDEGKAEAAEDVPTLTQV